MRLPSVVTLLCALVSCVPTPAASAPQGPVLYVSPTGRDTWSGRLPTPNAARTDGPLATVLGARDAIRRLRATIDGRPGFATVWVRGGTYRMRQPLVLEPGDSWTTYAAWRAERPVLSGGTVIRGWRRAPGGLWSAPAPRGAAFQQLWVNGLRRTRARTPNKGFFTIAGRAPAGRDPVTGKEVDQGAAAFQYAPGSIRRWPDLADAQVVVYHSWETSRLRIAAVDDSRRLVTFTGPAAWAFGYWGAGQRYYVENVRDALDAPGEWYLDRRATALLYRPLPGEDMRRAEVVAPRLARLLELHGEPDAGRFVERVAFRGLTFSHEDWTLEPQGHSDAQAASSVPAAIMADGARDCAFERCEISHTGHYGVWLRRGCKRCRVVHCRLRDLGTGGVRIGEVSMPPTDDTESSRNLVDNCHIYDGGHVYPAGCGIWVAQSSYNRITHNEIHDLPYTGISIGWNWDDAPNRTHHNVVERNHAHHLMNGVLSDGGAIYTLGVSPGSIIRGNLFHDIWPYRSPPFGWGIYLDATSAGYLVEGNVVYHTLSGGLMFNNGGHAHVIRNNVFAASADYAVWPFWAAEPNVVERNIIYQTQGQLLVSMGEASLKQRLAAGQPLGTWDRNLYWHTGGPDRLRWFGHTFADWQALGLDRHSRVADPRFVDPARGDFRLRPGSPALKLGFRPIDMRGAGLYGDPAWVAEGKQLRHPRTVVPAPPPPPKPLQVNDDFEATPVGGAPRDATVSGERQGASIRVTDEQAAAGAHSLKMVDVQGIEPSWEPHLFYQPHITTGVVRQSFDLRLGRDALLFTEWRDQTAYPGCIGPNVTFDGQGRVGAGGRQIATVPLERWFHVEVEAALGPAPSHTYTVTLTLPGEAPQVFRGLPISGADFHALHWLGFVSNATTDTTSYLDNVRIRLLSR